MSRAINQSDNYMSRLLKNIPSEIVAVYIAASGVVIAQNSSWMLWVIFGICLLATPFWLYFMEKVKSVVQIILTTVSFIIWVMTLGGPFATLWPEVTILGSVLLVLYTGLVVPIIASMISS